MKRIYTFLLCVTLGHYSANAQTGNVGVGNNTPVTKLDVAGDLALREGTAIAVSGANPTVVVTLSATNSENSFYRITGAPTGTMTLNSIANGVDGQIIALVNTTGISLKITNNNAASGILTATGTPITIPTSGSVTLQYSTNTNRWYILSASTGGVLPDWVKANTASDPAGTLDSQYVNAKIGIGDFDNGAPGGSNLEGWVTIKTNSGIPSIVNPINDQGLILQGSGGTPAVKSRLRLVSNNNGWADNVSTTYLQFNTDDNRRRLSILGGGYGNDVRLNRVQINSDSTQITDYDFGATPVPSSIFEVVSGINTAKNIFQLKGISSQTGNYMDISSSGAIRGDIMTVKSNGFVGIGMSTITSTPQTKLHIQSSNNTDAAISFTSNNGSTPTQTRIRTVDNNWSGDMLFETSVPGSGTGAVTERMRLKNTGDIQMTGATATANKLWLETNNWTDPGATGGAISVDNNSYKSMMIVGNNITGNHGQKREVQVWDYMKVNGYLTVGTESSATATDPPSGTMRYNSIRKCMEYWDGTYWICMGPPTVQKVTVRDQIDGNYTGTGCNACSGWAGSYGNLYTFTINNLYAGQKIMFYVEIFLDNDTHKNSAYANAMKIYGNGYWAEDESPSPGWEASITKVFPAQTMTGTSGNKTFTFECNQGFTDLRITAVAY